MAIGKTGFRVVKTERIFENNIKKSIAKKWFAHGSRIHDDEHDE